MVSVARLIQEMPNGYEEACYDKNAIQRIEAGKRFVTDIEIVALTKVFEVSFEELLNPEN